MVLSNSVGNGRLLNRKKFHSAVKAHRDLFFVGKIGNGGNVCIFVLFNAVKFRLDENDSVVGNADNGETVVCVGLRFFFGAGFPAEIVSAGKRFSYCGRLGVRESYPAVCKDLYRSFNETLRYGL